MGNIRGWAGPLSAKLRHYQYFLQQRIIRLQRSLGMRVALPAFSGYLPLAMKRLYPNTAFLVGERWDRFPDNYCCSLFLAPDQKPLFTEISNRFMERAISAYGTDHIYFADPFNEMAPPNQSVEYIKTISAGIYEAMQNVDKEAIWLLQGWMFINKIIWSNDFVRAFVTSVPIGKLLILDLQSEQQPQYVRTSSYYGQPFIWCMLHNFGGTLGMHGSVQAVNRGISQARQLDNSSMIGVGITPEGINQNYVMYSLALDRAWNEGDINLTKWFENYANVRYGVENAELQNVWHLLRDSVYSYSGERSIHGKYMLVVRPSIHLKPWIWYDPNFVYKAWSKLLKANKSIPKSHYTNYEYDLVDITRQYLQINAELLYANILNSYERKRNVDDYDKLVTRMNQLFTDLESILSCNVRFLLGRWLKSARSFAPRNSTEEEKRILEFNARNQVTIWGPNGEINDYAAKQWSGLIADYYAPRWRLFLEELRLCIMTNSSFNSSAFIRKVLSVIERPFSYQNKTYPVIPSNRGKTYSISRGIFISWSLRP